MTESTPMPGVGDPAPDFTLPDQDGKPVTLSDLRGRPVVVYFYPKAGTPGCTQQACGVRDHTADYERLGAEVLGISRDPVENLAAFASEHGLRFRLLSDADHKVAESYGVWVEKSMYGRKYIGMQRATFVIAPNGRIAHVIPKVRPQTHDEQVLAALETLAGGCARATPPGGRAAGPRPATARGARAPARTGRSMSWSARRA